MSGRILAIDATNWIHTLWHAQPGRDVIDRAVARMMVLAEGLEPGHLVACFDRRSFRHDLLPTYKAGRSEKPAELLEVLDAAPEAFALRCTVAIEDGFEADDQLATITAIGLATDRQVVLASPDKDIRQCLVSGRVSILRGFTVEHGKLKRPEWLTAKGVEEKYGVRPEQWTDFQALTGDAGDGIEGCPGFGPVNAQKVLSAAGTLDRVFTHILGLPITPRLRTSLLNWQPLARDVLRLVTLRTDCQAAADALR